MAVWGIACHLDAHEPVVVAVEAEGDLVEPRLREVFRHRTAESDEAPTKLWSLRAALGTKLAHARPAVIVVRQMQWPTPPARPNDTVVRSRLQMEGVIAELARNYTADIALLGERTIVEMSGSAADVLAAKIGEQLGRDALDAGLAAIAAMARSAGAEWPTAPARLRVHRARRPRTRRQPG
jgi:hypothetical protein